MSPQPPPTLHLYNSLGRELQEFRPREAGKVGLYCCGPTVYLDQHIGNMRAFLFEDFLRRTLEVLGFQVTHVMNITDVGHLTDDADTGEDKMLKSAREQGRTVWDVARYYTEQFLADTAALNIKRPTVVCKATEHVQDMIGLIQQLEAAGHTYVAGGNVFYDVSTFPGYGKLALLDRQDLRPGARIDVDQTKRNPQDFGLWFTQSKFERQAMTWESPWGTGYPGWHIECSAMSVKYLGEQFDIHCGGIDHIPVHHTNEIAQTEGATGKPWVSYWLHNEFLLIGGEKMAKSAGNLLTLTELGKDGFAPTDYRYFILSAHYRSQQNFTREALVGARASRLNLVDRIATLRGEAPNVDPEAPAPADSPHWQAFVSELCADLNLPRALAVLWGVVKNEDLSPSERLRLAFAMDRVTGLGLAQTSPRSTDLESLESRAAQLMVERTEARNRKDWGRADRIREELDQLGIVVEDTPTGVRWKQK